MTEKINVNIGCSTTPTTGWKNYDNSQAIFLAKFGIFADLFFKLRFISDHQYKVVNFYRKNKVVWADVTKYLPLESNTVNAIYSSHMFEHLDKDEAKKCLLEMRRVLEPGGILRLAHMARLDGANFKINPRLEIYFKQRIGLTDSQIDYIISLVRKDVN